MSIHDFDDSGHYGSARPCTFCDMRTCICGADEEARREHEEHEAELDRRDRERASILAQCRVFNLAYAVMKGWV